MVDARAHRLTAIVVEHRLGPARADDNERGERHRRLGQRLQVRILGGGTGPGTGAALQLMVPGELLAYASTDLPERRRAVEAAMESVGRLSAMGCQEAPASSVFQTPALPAPT